MLVIRRIGKRQTRRLLRGEEEKVVVAAGRLRLGVAVGTAHWADAFPLLYLAAKYRE